MSHSTPILGMVIPDHGEDVNSWDVKIGVVFDTLDALFAGSGGHNHDGTNGNGPKIDHDDLLNKGTNTHDQIDAHIADGATHFAASAMVVRVEDDTAAVSYPDAAWNNGPGGVDIVTKLRFKGARSITSPSAGIVLVDVTPVSGPTGPAAGVPSHLPPTTAPVAITDFFNGVPGAPLSRSNWFVTAPQLVELVMSQTGAHLSQDTTLQGVAHGSIVNRVKTQVPHSEVQRVTLHLCRLSTDTFVNSVTRFMVELSLMSSAYSGLNMISRLGFFFRIEVYKTGGTIYMDRTLFAVPTVLSSGLSQVVTLWSDTGPISNSRHYQGAHEFSLDRTHAFHYEYNNGPVNLGTAGNAGAATPYVGPLRQSLMLEPSLLAAGQLLPASQAGVAPHFGRFGFDVSWDISSGASASTPAKIDATVEYFTATSVDEEVSVYGAVLPQGDCAAAEPTPPAEPCCLDLSPTNTVGEDLFLSLPAPYGGGGWGDGMPSSAGAPVEADVFTAFRITGRISDGDPTYGSAGFLLRRLGQENNPNEPAHVVFCDPPANVTLEIVEPPRPGTRDAVIRLKGERIPSLVGRPQFIPAGASFLLTTNGALPPGAGAYPQPIPYPVPAQPGVLLGTSSAVVVGAWASDRFVDDSVVSNIRWYRDVASGDLVIKFDVADGLPYGSALDVTVPFLIHDADHIDYAAHPAIRSRIIMHPPKPEWVSAKLFHRDTTGAWTTVTTVTDITDVYLVAYGKKLPLPIVKENDTTPTLWGGFPVDLTTMPTKYVVIDADTGEEAVGVTIESLDMWKGWYDLDATDFPVGAAFPPTGNTPSSMLGETVSAHLSLASGLVGKRFSLRAVETEDPALPPADLAFPAVVGAAPTIFGVQVSNTDAGTLRAFTVHGRGFVASAVTVVSGGASAIASVVTAADGETVTFTATLPAAETVTFQIRNYSGTGASATFSVITDNATTPVISGITPASFVGGSVSVAVVVSGNANTFKPGAYLNIVPDAAVAITVHSAVLTVGALNRFDVVLDVPANAGSSYNIDFTVINPNTLSSSVVSRAVNLVTTPTVTSLTFYPENDYGGTPNPRGKERGARGWIKVIGTGFRAGSTVTVDVPDMVILGAVTVLDAVETKVWYEIGGLATIGQVVTLTYADLNGVGASADTLTFTIESRTPEIATVNVSNPFEGAGAAGAPAGSAKVYLAGRFFFEDGASAITAVAASGAATLTYPADVTVVDDNLILIKKLVLASNSAGQTATITVSAGSKTATYSFVVRDQEHPEITGWVVKPGMAAAAMDPIVVEVGATNYQVDLFGAALSTAVASADLILDGVSLLGSVAINPSSIHFSSVTVPVATFTDPVVYARLTLTGGGTYDIQLFQVTVATGTPNVTDVTVFNGVESTRGGSVEVIGTALGPSLVARAAFEPTSPQMMPLSVYPLTTVQPVSVVILEQSSTKLVLGIAVSDLVGFADGSGAFDLKLYGPDGSDVSSGGTASLVIEPFAGRPKFDTTPTITTTAAADNTALLFPLTVDGAPGSDGGEYIEVVRHANFTSTQALTGGLSFSTSTHKIIRSIGSWVTDGYAVGDYFVVASAEDVRNNGVYKIGAIGGVGNKEITVVTTAVPTGHPAYLTDVQVTNASDTTATVSMSPRIAHKVIGDLTVNEVSATWKNPAKVGVEVEVRLVSRDGRILDVRRFATT